MFLGIGMGMGIGELTFLPDNFPIQQKARLRLKRHEAYEGIPTAH